MVNAIVIKNYTSHMIDDALIGNIYQLDIIEASDDEAYIYKHVYNIKDVFKLQLFYPQNEFFNKPILKNPILVGVIKYSEDEVTFLHLPDKTDDTHQEITFRKV